MKPEHLAREPQCRRSQDAPNGVDVLAAVEETTSTRPSLRDGKELPGKVTPDLYYLENGGSPVNRP